MPAKSLGGTARNVEAAQVFYVYCLVSITTPAKRYVGFTEDLRDRLAAHNAGRNPATADGRPWRVKGYVAFDNKAAALAFERYLKSGSGHAFAKKRLW
jgi:predicted GIY-YIG superfamily endonuclease